MPCQTRQNDEVLTYGSLFTGIGGLDLGLDRAGWHCKFQVEIDPFCCKLLEKHWPGVPRYGDITKLRGDELARVDLLAGGFPCQDLSQAGKRAGIEGSRSGLWFEFARLIGELRPRYVLIENVPGLLVYDAMRRVIGELSRLGYVGCWRSLRASDFGASHLRKRIFIVAYNSRATSAKLADTRFEQEHLQQRIDGAEHPRGGDSMGNAERTRADPQSACGGSRQTISESGGHVEHSPCPKSARFGQFGEHLSGQAGPGELADSSEGRTRPRSTSPNVSIFCREYSVCHNPNECNGNDCWLKQQGLEYPIGFEPEEDYSVSDTGEPRFSDSELKELSTAQRHKEGRATPEFRGAQVADTEGAKPQGIRAVPDSGQSGFTNDGGRMGILEMQFAPSPGDPRWPAILRDFPALAPALESPVRRVAHGLPDWMVEAMSDRTKRLGKLGNAVVPQVAEWIGQKLAEFDRSR